jgi:hypothetical protein
MLIPYVDMEVQTLHGPSAFLEVMGSSPRNRILDFLLGEIGYDFTLKEIAERSHVGYATIKRIWNHFVSAKLVCGTRRIGKAVLYTYNVHSHNGKSLRRFYLDILCDVLEEEVVP